MQRIPSKMEILLAKAKRSTSAQRYLLGYIASFLCECDGIRPEPGIWNVIQFTARCRSWGNSCKTCLQSAEYLAKCIWNEEGF